MLYGQFWPVLGQMTARWGSWKSQHWESTLGASIQAPPRAPLAVAHERGWEDLLSQRQPSEEDHTLYGQLVANSLLKFYNKRLW